MSVFKDIILWKYERASWKWDVLCLLIMGFIFLTPKSWFDKRDPLATQNASVTVKAEEFSPDRKILEQQKREKTGNNNAEIIALTERRDAQGEVFYDIEVR